MDERVSVGASCRFRCSLLLVQQGDSPEVPAGGRGCSLSYTARVLIQFFRPLEPLLLCVVYYLPDMVLGAVFFFLFNPCPSFSVVLLLLSVFRFSDSMTRHCKETVFCSNGNERFGNKATVLVVSMLSQHKQAPPAAAAVAARRTEKKT